MVETKKAPLRVLAAALAAPLGTVLVVALAGCASTLPVSGDRSKIAPTLTARGLDPDQVVVPYELNEEMQAWAHQLVPRHTPFEKRLDLLVRGLLDPEKLDIRYESRHTGTAEEVFASRKANCLAFTSLFVGMAREVGVPAFYVDVDEIERFEKEGDLVVVSGHVSAGYGIARKELQILDFSPTPVPGKDRRVHPISDLTAIALFHSNRGAELLRAGQEPEALGWLRKAVAIDPELSGAWINYGVALRRTGKPDEAEAAYRKALEVDASAVSAYQNLSSLLRFKGKYQEAEQVLGLTARARTRNPYSYLALGDLSLSHGRFEEARRYYKKALRLYRDNAEPYAAMGLVSLASGDRTEASKWLQKAVAIDQENARVKQLMARIGPGPQRG
jgi:Flp pilus assembly protein TadD